ncbi:hypothetical protein CC80DRAFT_546714 [Byssothecium circinans]|uniref:Uncharacterized protein n=1 Tax=Byssothecium circinans TaxID=147558 RepID=A0A6A5U009_9PLEO|nr:hypothetical protein CC80DRAFT_546714 [Byssothecium circinans]
MAFLGQGGLPGSSNTKSQIWSTAVPVQFENKCWVSLFVDASCSSVCNRCTANTTPIRVGGRKVTYRIFSFGTRVDKFPGCKKLHESLLNEAVQELHDGTRVAVRVGVEPYYAIFIKDANGGVRGSIHNGENTGSGIDLEEFLRASNHILHRDPNPTTGARILPFQ